MNLKLQSIASLVEKEDTVIDTCCDHAYLAIYLKQNNLCKEVFASDISENALNFAKQNIEKSGVKVKTFLSDGFKDFYESSIDTAIIAGVGTNTALDIVNNAPKNVKKFIISSNNNHYDLRREMYNIGYYVQKEIVVYENEKFYPIMLFIRNFQKEDKFTLQFGKSGNMLYYKYLLEKEEEKLSHIAKSDFLTRFKCQKNIDYLKGLEKGPEL